VRQRHYRQERPDRQDERATDSSDGDIARYFVTEIATSSSLANGVDKHRNDAVYYER